MPPHKSPRIERLLRYERPLPMTGDPEWHGSWQARQEAVYRAMLAAKRAAEDLAGAIDNAFDVDIDDIDDSIP
jgi:hypothetical protein